LPYTAIETMDAFDNPAVGAAGWAALGPALPELVRLEVLGLFVCGGSWALKSFRYHPVYFISDSPIYPYRVYTAA
jgi:hypothetical protein